MNPFFLSSNERLVEWRRFRQSLIGHEDMAQLSMVCQWVSQAPTSNWVLDYDDRESWPGPWDLLNAGDFDEVAKAYLMEQTLIMVGWPPHRLRLLYVRNTSESFQTMILLVDDKWALNYRHATVLNFDTERQSCAYLASHSVTPQESRLGT